MLDGLLMLLTLSTVMAVASFLAGSLPLSFSLSQSRLKFISTIGMGVLVGTALIVIIPEGVETLYSASDSGHPHTHSRRTISPHSLDIRWQPNLHQVHQPFPRSYLLSARDDSSNDILKRPPIIPIHTNDPDQPAPKAPEPPPPPKDSPSPIKPPTLPETPSILPDEPHASSRTPHAWIGLSLILGFILMYLLDTLPALSPSAKSRPQSTNIYSLSDLSSTAPPSQQHPQRTLSTTLGLCIHAAADGIALGASSTSSATTSLSLIIFVAIMVHKAPAAFGLTAVLLKQGLGKRGARAHLVVFSLAAPAGAVATWVVVRALGGGGAEEEGMRWWTGVLLLFSGGTFLYVAMHTMQDADSPAPSSIDNAYNSLPSDEPPTNGYLDGSLNGRETYRPNEGKSLRLVMAAVGGMLLPLLTQVGHAH